MTMIEEIVKEYSNGAFQMIHTDGKDEVKNQITAFCRCEGISEQALL